MRPRLSLFGAVVACLGALLAFLLARTFVPPVPPESLTPAAYLHAAPALLMGVAVLCVFAGLWHLLALLRPSGALAEDAESRAAFGRAMDRGGGGA